LISAQVGGLPLPSAITSALERPMNERMQAVSAVLLPPGYVMTAISTTEHHLLMTISSTQADEISAGNFNLTLARLRHR
ncbi:MAG TPA: hypothetical protein VGF38_23185, partial [Ktedonobacterales bacterium]